MTPRKPEVVDPTPETIGRRVVAFGDWRSARELCSPVDLLFRQLDERQQWAGQYARVTYARYCIAINAPRLVSGQLRDLVEGGGSSGMDEEAAQAAVEAYSQMITAIRRYSLRSLKQVERIMHGSMPRDVQAMKDGLTALADHMKL